MNQADRTLSGAFVIVAALSVFALAAATVEHGLIFPATIIAIVGGLFGGGWVVGQAMERIDMIP